MLRKQLIYILMSSVGLVSCNYLDFDESQGMDKSDAYGYFNNVTRLASAVYREVPEDYGVISNALRESATDNAVYTWSSNAVYKIYSNAWSPINLVDDKWGTYYGVIHDANSFLENYSEDNLKRFEWDPNYEDNLAKTEMYKHEVRVLRALYYFELAKRYGDVPLLTRTYSLDEINSVTKTSFQDVIAFVAEECAAVAPELPLDQADFFNETGRVTRGAALAIRARALLYAASPLFAGTGDASAKWEAAAKAAYDVIGLGKYSLPSIASDPLYNAEGGNIVLNSPQLIFWTENNEDNTFEANNMPIGFEGAEGGTTPAQNLVDDFEMKDGTPFDWNNPSHVANMYYDNAGNPTRDPRLYLTVIGDGMTWMGVPVEPLAGGRNSASIDGGTLTGYYLKKLMNENVSLDPVTPVKKYHHYPGYRYAEVLLNYAEAMNEWQGPDYTDEYCVKSARQALNEVRAAAGMPAVVASGKAEFREKVRKERRIELAFEDHRFWDIRRWKIGEVVRNIYGIEKLNNAYTRVQVQTRTWEDKMYLYPIPQNEVFVNRNLTQNPGWEVAE